MAGVHPPWYVATEVCIHETTMAIDNVVHMLHANAAGARHCDTGVTNGVCTPNFHPSLAIRDSAVPQGSLAHVQTEIDPRR